MGPNSCRHYHSGPNFDMKKKKLLLTNAKNEDDNRNNQGTTHTHTNTDNDFFQFQKLSIVNWKKAISWRDSKEKKN